MGPLVHAESLAGGTCFPHRGRFMIPHSGLMVPCLQEALVAAVCILLVSVGCGDRQSRRHGSTAMLKLYFALLVNDPFHASFNMTIGSHIGNLRPNLSSIVARDSEFHHIELI